MLDPSLTSISTFGWFQEQKIVEDLTPISMFGWWFTAVKAGDELVTFMLCLQTVLERNFER